MNQQLDLERQFFNSFKIQTYLLFLILSPLTEIVTKNGKKGEERKEWKVVVSEGNKQKYFPSL